MAFNNATGGGKAFDLSPIVRQRVVPRSASLCTAWLAVNTERSDAGGYTLVHLTDFFCPSPYDKARLKNNQKVVINLISFAPLSPKVKVEPFQRLPRVGRCNVDILGKGGHVSG